jgi:subtilisin family serine protease
LAEQEKMQISELTDESKNTMIFLGRQFLANRRVSPELPEPLLWSVSNNRKATISVTHSVPCTKADAGRRLFDIDGASISWAVVDSGIDAEHPAFRKIDPDTKKNCKYAMTEESDSATNFTRVVATYDFTQFRKVISELTSNTAANDNNERLLTSLPTGDKQDRRLPENKKRESMRAIETALNNGRMLDWTVLGPLLRIPHSQGNYKKPLHPHGTHVAGIIGAGMVEGVAEWVLVGMCPRINLYDFRVLDQNGEGDEFNIIAALQFIRWINQHDGLSIHGVNLSMSLYHDVETYACGHTPVCTSANRLVEEGIVVVAAAGNQGQSLYQSDSGITSQGFRTVNITDPGNAEDVITVGATHRNEPHRYGVSYFSSKGPTGDGRIKPDLVAPGEKIYSAVLNEGIDAMDGTSMAAPHVSGAAALVMSKHRELIGRPRRIKDILCKTATDLGRERYFQGCGMVDVLRAIQSV